MYQLWMEIRIENNIPLSTLPNVKIIATTNANVLQNNEFKVRQSWQNIHLLGEWVWNKVVQNANNKLDPHFVTVVFTNRKAMFL